MKKKKRVVLSGVNMTEGGILSIYREVMSRLGKIDDIELFCLVSSKSLFDSETIGNARLLEFSHVKKSWFSRIKFEYFDSYFISKKINPDVWISLHDITPNVHCNKQYVYCHNPSPFYKSGFNDFKFDKRFWLFTLFYKYLYKINIKKNTAVIVQQSWMAEQFQRWYSPRLIMISKPVAAFFNLEGYNDNKALVNNKKNIKLFYPAFPRTFKNFEVIISAFLELKKRGYNEHFTMMFTFDENTNKYSKEIVDVCRRHGLSNIIFLGVLDKHVVQKKYEETDIVIFPSKLETWGLPITEAKSFNKPILLADLPYAHESLGDYNKVNFFDPNDSNALADLLVMVINESKVFGTTRYSDKKNFPTYQSWSELFEHIL